MLKQLYGRISMRNIFLIDFIGALVTTACYVLIYLYFKDSLGFSNYMVRVLMGVAVLYAMYSCIMYMIQPKNWKSFLKVIAYANLLFCGIAYKFLISYFEGITFLGKVYLMVEIILVFFVAQFELFYIKSKSKANSEQ